MPIAVIGGTVTVCAVVVVVVITGGTVVTDVRGAVTVIGEVSDEASDVVIVVTGTLTDVVTGGAVRGFVVVLTCADVVVVAETAGVVLGADEVVTDDCGSSAVV